MYERFGKKQSWAGNSFKIFLSFLCIHLCIYLSSIHPCVCIPIHTRGYIFSFSHSVMSDSLQPHGLQPTRLLCSWNSPGKNTGVDSHSLLQRIFLTQGLNPGLLHCRWILYHLSHQGKKLYILFILPSWELYFIRLGIMVFFLYGWAGAQQDSVLRISLLKGRACDQILVYLASEAHTLSSIIS